MPAGRPGCVAVIVLLDADDDASCEIGPIIVERSPEITGIPVIAAIAERDHEDWIYASAETLECDIDTWSHDKRGLNAIRESLPDKYVKAIHQARLTALMNLELARSRNHSLDRLLHKLDDILQNAFAEGVRSPENQ